MFRVPLLRQQLKRLNHAMEQTDEDESAPRSMKLDRTPSKTKAVTEACMSRCHHMPCELFSYF